jgi:hypothetical protein
MSASMAAFQDVKRRHKKGTKVKEMKKKRTSKIDSEKVTTRTLAQVGHRPCMNAYTLLYRPLHRTCRLRCHPTTGARPSVRLCVGPELARCVNNRQANTDSGRCGCHVWRAHQARLQWARCSHSRARIGDASRLEARFDQFHRRERVWCLARTLSVSSEIQSACYSCESAYKTRRDSIAFAGVIAIFFAFGFFGP